MRPEATPRPQCTLPCSETRRLILPNLATSEHNSTSVDSESVTTCRPPRLVLFMRKHYYDMSIAFQCEVGNRLEETHMHIENIRAPHYSCHQEDQAPHLHNLFQARCLGFRQPNPFCHVHASPNGPSQFCMSSKHCRTLFYLFFSGCRSLQQVHSKSHSKAVC